MSKRKANLNKLRLPRSGSSDTRIGQVKAVTTISHFFSTGVSETNLSEEEETTAGSSREVLSPIEKLEEQPDTGGPSRSTRTKLSTFLPKEKRMKADEASKAKKRQSNDFETPNKIVKKAPKTNTKRCTKRQQKIKSAFFKNEKIFSAVAAQHCLADNVNPEEMEMALALSMSMSDADANKAGAVKDAIVHEDEGEEEKENIRDKLKKFGFRVGEPEDYSLTAFMPVKGKTKWANKFTALTLRNAKRQLEKVNQRVEEFLSTQFLTTNSTAHGAEVCSYSVQSEILLPLVASDRIIRSDENERVNVVDFYVLSLFEPSRTRAGHLLRDVRHIPGRDRSPRKTKHIPKEPKADLDPLLRSPGVKKGRFEETLLKGVLSLPTLNTVNNAFVREMPSTFPTNDVHTTDIANECPIVIECATTGNTSPTDCNNTGTGKLSFNVAGSVLGENTSRNLNVTTEMLELTPTLGLGGSSHSHLTSIRAPSPDIFADSDAENETSDSCAEMECLKISTSSSNSHQITTFETFSSDEVKTTSVTGTAADNIIDLTQSPNRPALKNVPFPSTSINFAVNLSVTLNSKFNDMASILNSGVSVDNLDECDFFDKSSCSNRAGFSFGSGPSEKLNQSNFKENTQSSTQSADISDALGIFPGNFGSSASEELNISKSEEKTLTRAKLSEIRDLIGSSPSRLTLNEMASSSSFTKPAKSHSSDKSRNSNGARLSFGTSAFGTSNSEENLVSSWTEIAEIRDAVNRSVLFKEIASNSGSYNPTESKSFDKPTCSRRAGFSFDSGASDDASFEMSQMNDEIDLTQDSSDCFILSNDEVNYSIWKADNSIHVDNVSIDHLIKGSDEPEKKHEFSVVSLIEDSQPLPDTQDDVEMRTSSNTSLNSLGLDSSNRSEFGILDEKSPFKTPTTTPKKTPSKTPSGRTPSCASAKFRKALTESFIVSPETNLVPVNRLSSGRKFYEFTQSDSDNSVSELDDIDKIVFGTPPSKEAYKKPAGLDELLTKPITTTSDSTKSGEDSQKKFEFDGRTYLVRTKDFPQKPNFEMMDESTLGARLDKYGVKNLNRKQAIKMLEYIYNQTHPYLVNEGEIHPQITATKNDKDDDNVSTLNADDDVHTLDKIGGQTTSASKFDLKDCGGDRLLSEAGMTMEVADEEYVFQTNTSKKILTAALPFHVAWYNLVKSNRLLHETILYYEPIDLREIYLFFKTLGYRYDPKELKKFFDSRSIIFRYELDKNPSAGANRHQRRHPPQKNRRKIRGVI